jgi:hypothetical protein
LDTGPKAKGLAPLEPPPCRDAQGLRIARFPPLVIGVTAALLALVLAVELFPKDPMSVLGPVLSEIGAFTGHAAGHPAAKDK